jgi:hypothetical protein
LGGTEGPQSKQSIGQARVGYSLDIQPAEALLIVAIDVTAAETAHLG